MNGKVKKEEGRGRAKEWQNKENTEKKEGLTVSWLFLVRHKNNAS